MRPDHPLLRLFGGDDALARERYAAFYRRLVKFFEYRRVESPEDLVQETFVRGLRRLGEGVPLDTDPEGYFYGVAKMLLFEDARAQRRAARQEPLPDDLADELPAPTPPDPDVDKEVDPDEWAESLRTCLAELRPDERTLILEYYMGDHAALRARLNVTANALRIRAFRLRAKLEQAILLDLERRGKLPGG